MTDSITIPTRFRGPPDSGNGGYVCGLLAARLDSPAPIVRLQRPPPLEKPLQIHRSDAGVSLRDGGVVLAEARPGELAVDVPDPPGFEEAQRAEARFRGFEEHVFPGCFVCGPERAGGDGLRIFPGPIEGPERAACTWIPDPSLPSTVGRVDEAFLWAALDCPGAFSFPQPDSPMLLGELQVEIRGPVRIGERCVLLAWAMAHDGRKHRTATALYGEAGECRGLGIATWIEINKR